MTALKHLKKGGQVIAALRARPGAKRRVKAALIDQRRTRKGHVRARAKLAGRKREQRIGRAVGTEVKHAASGALVIACVALEQLLRTGYEFVGNDLAGHATDIGGTCEGLDEPLQPMLIGDDVVVGEGHKRSCHLTQPTVVSGGKAEPRALDIPQRPTLGVAGDDGWRVIASR